MEAVAYIFLAGYALIFVLTLARLLQGRQQPIVATIVALLWPFTLFFGIRMAERFNKTNAVGEEIFGAYRTVGFDTLKVKNGSWIAGFAVADMDRGGHLILVIPGFDAAPEDLQEVIAHPFSDPREAILDSIKRNAFWKQRLKERTKTARSFVN